MSKIQLNKNQKEVLFIVALFLVPFLDPGFALLLTRVRDKDCVKNRVKRAKIVRITLC